MDASLTHDFSIVVKIFKCHCGNVGRTYKRFHVRWEQYVTKKFRRFVFNEDIKPKGEQPFTHSTVPK